jgi:hypothetical protein
MYGANSDVGVDATEGRVVGFDFRLVVVVVVVVVVATVLRQRQQHERGNKGCKCLSISQSRRVKITRRQLP